MKETEVKAVELIELPKLRDNIKLIGEEVAAMIDGLNIDSLVASEDTKKSLKEMKAKLNKDAKAYHEQMKAVEGVIYEPFSKIKEDYNTYVKIPITKAVEQLTAGIGVVELKQKEEKRNNIKAYFDELIAVQQPDFELFGISDLSFINFDDMNLNINISTTEKKLREQTLAFTEKVIGDLKLITQHEHAAAILARYKLSTDYDISKYTIEINELKRKEAEELARQKQAECNRRQRLLLKLPVTVNETLKSFEFGNLSVSYSELLNMSGDQFNAKLAEFEQQANIEQQAAAQENKTITKQEQVPAAVIHEPKVVSPAPTAQPQAQPQLQPKDGSTKGTKDPNEVIEVSFKVSGRRADIVTLGNVMIEMNLNPQKL